MSVDPKELWAANNARRVAVAHYLYNPRVTLIDVGWKIKGGKHTDQLAVRIHLRDKPTGAAFESFSMQNQVLTIDKGKIPFDVVDLVRAKYLLHDYYWPVPYAQVNERARRCDPLCGGISISNGDFYSYGTLGSFVIDKNNGDEMLLSNWHVLAGSFYVPKGQKIYQPGTGDGGGYRDAIATLERDGMVDGIDAAVAKLDTNRDWINNQLDLGLVKGSDAPCLGMRVVKSGRGSGVTHGMIDGIYGEYPILYGGLWRKVKYVQRIVPQADQTEVSRPGDSGLCWLNEDTYKAVGLHFAGFDDPETALAIAMPQVLTNLGVEILV